MKIPRALRSQRKENIIRVVVVLGIVSVLEIAGNLSSLRVHGLVRQTRRREHKVTKDRTLRSSIEGNQNIRAFAWGRKWGTGIVWDLALRD